MSGDISDATWAAVITSYSIHYTKLYESGTAITVDSAGDVYVADTYNTTIRKVTPGGVVTTLAGAAGTFPNPTGGTLTYGGNADGTRSA